MYKIIWIINLTIFFSSIAAQDFDQGTFYGGLFYTSNLIASDEFKSYGQNDLDKVDYLFSKTLEYFHNDISEALLCLAFSTLPFNKIEIKLPLGLDKLNIPLPSPHQTLFEKRRNNLPGKIFFDSPGTGFGDKDKLAHFFGNAFLRYSIPFFNLSKFMGIFVEKTEENFFANGSFDRKDIIANHLGEFFAELLQTNPQSKPSNALKIYQLLFFRVCR